MTSNLPKLVYLKVPSPIYIYIILLCLALRLSVSRLLCLSGSFHFSGSTLISATTHIGKLRVHTEDPVEKVRIDDWG